MDETKVNYRVIETAVECSTEDGVVVLYRCGDSDIWMLDDKFSTAVFASREAAFAGAVVYLHLKRQDEEATTRSRETRSALGEWFDLHQDVE